MMRPLEKVLVEEISHAPGGSIPFIRFMELALYHPLWGYYQQERPKWGKHGDYYTSPMVGDVFGRVMSGVLETMHRSFCRTGSWAIVEFGGGDGRWAEQLLEGLRETAVFSSLTYVMVERSADHRRRQRERLARFGSKVMWTQRPEPVFNSVPCVVLSNELIDAFPVHRLRKENGQWREIHVSWDERRRLHEVTRPITDPALFWYVEKWRESWPDGTETEVNTRAREWLNQVAVSLREGFVVTFDYGGREEEVRGPHRPEGTIRCYSRHHAHRRLYDAPGEADITADVNFDDLMRWGKKAGLETVWYGPQSRFLVAAGILRLLTEHHDPDPFSASARRNRAIRHLVLSEGMGARFRVLIQAKGVQFDELADVLHAGV
jgi:SAM-dependent MidA family methyltransferase